MLAKLIQPCFENHIMEYFRNLLRKETPKVKDIKKRNNEIYNTVMVGTLGLDFSFCCL